MEDNYSEYGASLIEGKIHYKGEIYTPEEWKSTLDYYDDLGAALCMIFTDFRYDKELKMLVKKADK